MPGFVDICRRFGLIPGISATPPVSGLSRGSCQTAVQVKSTPVYSYWRFRAGAGVFQVEEGAAAGAGADAV